MTHEQVVHIGEYDTKAVNHWLSNNDDTNHLGEDDTFIETANFGNGFEMDVKCCGTQDGPAWTEAVLFKNGSEVCCSEPSEDFFGDWILEYNGDTFITHVIKYGDEENAINSEKPLVAMATPPVSLDDTDPEPVSEKTTESDVTELIPELEPESEFETEPDLSSDPKTEPIKAPEAPKSVVPTTPPITKPNPADYKTNTKVTYLYRDGGNYKLFLEEVFRGKLSEDQMKAFNRKYAEQGFYPSKLQMNDMMTVASKDGNDPDYHEFTRLILVQEHATVNKHINEFVEAFESKKCLAF